MLQLYGCSVDAALAVEGAFPSNAKNGAIVLFAETFNATFAGKL